MRESVAQAKGYTTLPYHVRGRAFHGHLFARPHVSRGDDIELPAKRTLFLLNVPLHLTADDVAAAFTRKDEEPIVRLGGIGTTLSTVGTCTAHVVFAQPAGLRRALAASKPLEFPAAEAAADNDPGVPSRAELQQNVGAFMEQFEAAEKKRQAEEDARHNQMDSDGFVLVTRKRSGRNTSTEEATGATVGVASGGGVESEERAAKKKKKAKELTDFYHFQQHERKREGLMKLREQFEQDKARIAKMRADRKFRPQGY